MHALDTEKTNRLLYKTGIEIILISFIILFQEMVFIRWLPGQVRVLAYFPNLILISAFLGLGIGCLRADSRSVLWFWPISIGIVVGATIGLSRIAFTQNSASEHLWLLYYDLPQDSPIIQTIYPPIILFFLLGMLSFIPIGQILAERLNVFRTHSILLWGYSWNLVGSLLGVIVFSVASFFQLFPVIWFGILLGGGLWLFLPRKFLRILYTCSMIIILLLVHQAERFQYYSPYYAVNTEEHSSGQGFVVMTNGSLHQNAYPLQSTDLLMSDWGKTVREGYHFPYRQLTSIPKRVLVLGAGTGNDIAVLLDRGVERIDAVEIDPVIVALGKKHPNHPYDSERVRVITTDARSYLNETENTYDLIVFGTLDSMTKLSALSNVRLDNFVYTRECIQAARDRLNARGGIIFYFMVSAQYIEDRLFGLLAAAFDELPVVRAHYSYLFNRIYMAGPAFSHLVSSTLQDRTNYFEYTFSLLDIPTDDWPYLYLQSRGISPFYRSLILVFIGIAIVSVALASHDMRKSFTAIHTIDLEMFFFGLAFLLLETKSVITMNLIWGATWITSAIVFGTILLVLFLSTVIMQYKPLRWGVAASSLLVTLGLTYLLPTQHLLVENPLLKFALSAIFIGSPIFFASACFALRFRERQAVNIALGWNLLGAVVGGLLEFLSMLIGLKSLALVAMLAYLGAFWVQNHQQSQQNTSIKA